MPTIIKRRFGLFLTACICAEFVTEGIARYVHHLYPEMFNAYLTAFVALLCFIAFCLKHAIWKMGLMRTLAVLIWIDEVIMLSTHPGWYYGSHYLAEVALGGCVWYLSR